MAQQTEKRSLQSIIIEHALATPEQMNEAVDEAQVRREPLRDTLTRTGLVSERDVAVCYAEYLKPVVHGP